MGSATISTWENVRHPTTPPESRLEPYARFAVGGGELPSSVTELTAEARLEYEDLLQQLRQLWQEARGQAPDTTVSHHDSPPFLFTEGAVTVIVPDAPATSVGPLAEPRDPNYTWTHGLADVDALLDLVGFIRAQNGLGLAVDVVRGSEATASHLVGHVILIGGIGWNDVTKLLLRALHQVPVRQEADAAVPSGEIFVVREQDGQERRLLPQWSVDETELLTEDVGLLVRVPNPFNSGRTLTLCNGIHSRGVLGAVRILTDPDLRETNELYLSRRFPGGQFAVAVRVPVVLGQAVAPDLGARENLLFEWPAANPGIAA